MFTLIQSINMLGMFKDSFGKKAGDLHKKEFFDAKVENKYTIKSKTADGVAFEGFATSKGKGELNLNFKDSDMEVKNKLDQDAIFTVDSTMFKVADGMDATLVFKTPACSSADKALFSSVALGGKYATADLNAALTCTGTFKDGFAPDAGTIDLAVVAKVMDDINAGLNLTKMDKDMNASIDFAVCHATKEYQIAAHFNAAMKNKEFAAKDLTASFWQQATADTAVAAAFSCDTEMKVGLTLGTDFKLTPSSNIKTKVGYVKDASPSIDLAWVQKFDGKTLSVSHSVGNGSNFGINLTIDC